MQYVLDQSVRLINMGFTPDEIAETIHLPKSVVIEPWTIEYYGNVDVSARNVYGGYISWWNGDPAELDPTPAAGEGAPHGRDDGRTRQGLRRSREGLLRRRSAVGGRTHHAAHPHRQEGLARAVAEGRRTAQDRLQADEQQPARLLPHWRAGNRRPGRPGALQQKLAGQLFSAESVPSETLLNMLRYRINPERALGKHLTIGYRFTDTGEDFTLTLRNSVLQIQPERAAKVDARVEMTRKQFNQLFEGKLSPERIADAQLTGNKATIKDFFAVLDHPTDLPIPNIALR